MDNGHPVRFGMFINPIALAEHSLAVRDAVAQAR
jgi:3-dehydroquinate dehydratase